MLGAEEYAKERIRKLTLEVAGCLPTKVINEVITEIRVGKPIPIPADLADFHDCLVECLGYRITGAAGCSED